MIIELASGLLLAMAPVALWLPLCILLERHYPRAAMDIGSRFPGAFLLIVTPALVTLLSLPMRQVWDWVGIAPLISLTALHPAMQCLLLLMAIDFLRYVEHRVEHRLWWPVHSVHHAQNDLHAANSFGHPLMGIPEYLLVVIPLSLIDSSGLGPMVAATLITALQNLLIHSPVKFHLGPLRRIFVDSRFHRIHHSVEPRHFGKNFGLLFTLWDQLFRTACFPGPDEWPAVGVEDLAPATTFRGYLLPPQILRWGRRPSVQAEADVAALAVAQRDLTRAA